MNLSNVSGHGWATLVQFGEDRGVLNEIKRVFEVESLSTFTKRVSEFSSRVDCTHYDDTVDIVDAQNKVKGDLFEVFTIMFMNAIGGDRTYRILGTKWAPRDQAGFDFTAVDKDGNTVLLQSKFRSNVTEEFESNQLETFLGEGNNLGGPVQRVLFTNATKISSRYRRFEREGNMQIIDGSQIKKHAGKGFWKVIAESVNELFFDETVVS